MCVYLFLEEVYNAFGYCFVVEEDVAQFLGLLAMEL